jgi:hypothetical protein
MRPCTARSGLAYSHRHHHRVASTITFILHFCCADHFNYILEWKLYVGSASSSLGCVKRWYTYLGVGTPEKTAHSQEIRKPGRLINLRCVAHFGFKPEFWLTTFAETIFRLFFGTVQDTRYGDYNSMYLNDALYDEIQNIRSTCDLPEPQPKGLNRTWPLL